MKINCKFLILGVVGLVLLAYFGGRADGKNSKEREFKIKAVEHGAAEWIVIDSKGNTEFQWMDNTSTESQDNVFTEPQDNISTESQDNVFTESESNESSSENSSKNYYSKVFD